MAFGLGEPLVLVGRLGQKGIRGSFDRILDVQIIVQSLQETPVAVFRCDAGTLKSIQASLGGGRYPLLINPDDVPALLPERIQPFPGKVLSLRQIPQAHSHFLQPALQGEVALLAQILLHAAGEPLQQLAVAFLREAVQHAVHALGHQRLPVQLHLIGGKLADFPGKSPQRLLEKAVDGAHGKGRIVVQDAGELLLRPLLQLDRRHPQFLLQIAQIGGFLRCRGQHVQLLQNAALHLVGGLVGKGHGQHVAVGIGLVALQEQPDVFLGQVICLAGSRRRFENLNHAIQI